VFLVTYGHICNGVEFWRILLMTGSNGSCYTVNLAAAVVKITFEVFISNPNAGVISPPLLIPAFILILVKK